MMEKNNKQIDGLFKNTFEQINFDNADQHWEDVYEHVESRKKKKKGLFWFRWALLGIILIGLISTPYYFGNDTDKDKKSEKEIISEPIADLGGEHFTSKSNSTKTKDTKNENTTLQTNSIKTALDDQNINHHINEKNKIAAIIAYSPRKSSNNFLSKRLKDQPSTVYLQNANNNFLIDEIGTYSINELRTSTNTIYVLDPLKIANEDKAKQVKSTFKKWDRNQIISLLMSPVVGNKNAYSGIRYGWGIERYFTSNIFVSSSLSIVYQRTNNGFNTIISQSSFGLKTTTKHYGIQTKHLQYIHVPILVGIKLKQHKISAGAGANLYLGAFGKINQVDPDLGNPIKEIGKGWISSTYAKKLVPELSGYYSYKMKRLTLGASIHYYTDSFYPKPSLLNITPKKEWSVGLNVIYPLGRIFK